MCSSDVHSIRAQERRGGFVSAEESRALVIRFVPERRASSHLSPTQAVGMAPDHCSQGGSGSLLGSPGSGYTIGSLQQPGGRARSATELCLCCRMCHSHSCPPCAAESQSTDLSGTCLSSTPTSSHFPFGGFAFQTSKKKKLCPILNFSPSSTYLTAEFSAKCCSTKPITFSN